MALLALPATHRMLELDQPKIGTAARGRSQAVALRWRGPSSNDARYLHPQPCRSSFKARYIVFAPLMPGQQLGRLERRHPEGRADLGGSSDPPLLQLSVDRYP